MSQTQGSCRFNQSSIKRV